MRGGKREGAGRPQGTKKEPTTSYYRRVNPKFVPILDKVLNALKKHKQQKSPESKLEAIPE